jgi:hypothetical protein
MMLHDITVTTDYDIGEGWTGERPRMDIIGNWRSPERRQFRPQSAREKKE